jgi:hypothetical protein
MHLFNKIKIELWIIYLIFICLLIWTVIFGSLVRHEILAPQSRFPITSRTALFLAEIPSNLTNIAMNDLTTHDQRYANIKGFQGKPLEQETYLLLSKYEGDEERSVVELVDLRSFEVIKTWRPDINQINDLVDTSQPEFQYLNRDKNIKRYMMTHPFLTKDGGLIFQNLSPLVKIDQNSQLVWQNQVDEFHHSIEQDHEGNFWVSTSVYPYQADEKYVGTSFGNFRDDAITKVSVNGEILFQKSVTNILIENKLIHLLFQVNNTEFLNDPIHINDIQPVLTDGPNWKRGDVFLSLRHQSMIILYRPSTNKIIWKGALNMHAQHDINILDDHRISFFNNNAITIKRGSIVDGYNEVIIYDFKTDSYSKYLNKSLEQYDVRSLTEGRSQILDNNDLFVEDQNNGRILYFNKDGSLQWQYVNCADDGKVYFVKWSRILYKPKDIRKIQKIINLED